MLFIFISYFRENFGKIFAKIRNENNTKYRGISFREIFVATLSVGGYYWTTNMHKQLTILYSASQSNKLISLNTFIC